MRPEDLLQWIKASPFVPFRIKLNSGRTFDIRHPEMLKVGRTIVMIFTYTDEAGDIYERAEMISLVLIESISPLEAQKVM